MTNAAVQAEFSKYQAGDRVTIRFKDNAVQGITPETIAISIWDRILILSITLGVHLAFGFVVLGSKFKKLVIGDVRTIRQNLDVGSKTNQKLHQWSFGSIRHKHTYKAERLGMRVGGERRGCDGSDDTGRPIAAVCWAKAAAGPKSVEPGSLHRER